MNQLLTNLSNDESYVMKSSIFAGYGIQIGIEQTAG